MNGVFIPQHGIVTWPDDERMANVLCGNGCYEKFDDALPFKRWTVDSSRMREIHPKCQTGTDASGQATIRPLQPTREERS